MRAPKLPVPPRTMTRITRAGFWVDRRHRGVQTTRSDCGQRRRKSSRAKDAVTVGRDETASKRRQATSSGGWSHRMQCEHVLHPRRGTSWGRPDQLRFGSESPVQQRSASAAGGKRASPDAAERNEPICYTGYIDRRKRRFDPLGCPKRSSPGSSRAASSHASRAETPGTPPECTH